MTLYVNGELISQEIIQTEIENLRPEYEKTIQMDDKQAKEAQLTQWAKENVIERTLLAQAARKRYKQIPDNEIERAFEEMAQQCGGRQELLKQLAEHNVTEKKVREDIANGLRMERLFKDIMADVKEPGDEDIEAFFEENKEHFTLPEMIRASHIVKQPRPGEEPSKIKAEMERIREKLLEDGDFEKLAKQHSDCNDQGGDLGFFPRGHMVPAFEEVVFNMKPGELSDVFETEFGFHIAKVTDSRPAGPCDINDAREMIVEELTNQNRQKAIEDYIDSQKAQAIIEEK